MKRTIIRIALILLLFGTIFFMQAVAATLDMAGELEQYLAGDDIREIEAAMPESAQAVLEERGFSSFEELTSMPAGELWNIIKERLSEEFHAPLRVLVSLVGAVLLCAIMKSFASTLDSTGPQQIFRLIITAYVISLLIQPIIQSILEIGTTFEEFSLFLSVYIPVFAGIITTAGQPMTGAVYNVLLFSACQGIGQLLGNLFIPVISCYLSLAIVTEVVPQMGLQDIVAGFKKLITWTLGLTMTLFVGLLSLQSVIASSGDNVAVKTTKFMISSFIPAVGGSLSELFMATQGCVQLLKGTVGAAGVVIAVFTFLPVLLRVTLWQLTAAAGSIIGQLMGVPEISRLLKSVGSALSVMLAILLYYAMLFIVSTSIMILAFRGG